MSTSDISHRRTVDNKKQRIRFSIDDNACALPSAKTKSERSENETMLEGVNFDNVSTGPRKNTLYLHDEAMLMLWHWGPAPINIDKDFTSKRSPFKEDDAASVHTTLEDFDPAIHNPVFYGKMHEKIEVTETDIVEEADPATTHPATIGHALVDRPKKSPPPPPIPLPDLKTSSPRDYLQTYIFPVLLPALEEMLKQAKTEKCFERKRTKFNGCDFLTEYIFNNNPGYPDRQNVPLGEIPFVAEHWKLHPRPPLPMSLLWTEEEATLIVQSHFRAFKVRCEPEIQGLRKWQREWREENANITNKVNDFWAKQMPDDDLQNLSDNDKKTDEEAEQSNEDEVGGKDNKEEGKSEDNYSPELRDTNDETVTSQAETGDDPSIYMGTDEDFD